MVNVSVETWMTDLYRCNQWWIALPNVEDVSDVNRGRVAMDRRGTVAVVEEAV